MDKTNKILVVDDDPNILELMEETLGEKGYDVISVDNGYSAFLKAKEEEIGLIVLDLLIPRIDGVSLCQKLKALGSTKNIPILIISAHAKKELVVKLLRLGVNNFLTKPFDVDKLINRVNELYSSSTDPAPSVLTNLKVKYAPGMNILNIKLIGELASTDPPVLISDIGNQLQKDIKKIMLNVADLNAFGVEQVNAIQKIKDHFEANDIKFNISTGNLKDLRINLLKSSKLKENLLTY